MRRTKSARGWQLTGTITDTQQIRAVWAMLRAENLTAAEFVRRLVAEWCARTAVRKGGE